MRTLFAACAALSALGALGGCAALSGTVDDNGRVFRQATEADIEANLQPLAAEPTIQLLNDPLPRRGEPSSRSGGGEPASACQAERFQHLIGMTEADVAGRDLPDGVRVISFGAMVTQDYRPERMNVHLDQNGRVYRVICG